MSSAIEFVAACEALAESFEQAGRVDLATLCDRAAYWLEGGPRVECLSIEQVVSACHETLMTESHTTDTIMQDVDRNIQRLQQTLATAAQDPKPERLIGLAARLQAVAILTEKLF